MPQGRDGKGAHGHSDFATTATEYRERGRVCGKGSEREAAASQEEGEKFPRASLLPHNGFKYKYEFPRENAFNYSARACAALRLAFFSSVFPPFIISSVTAAARVCARARASADGELMKTSRRFA